ncbi:MAG: AraC family transcriptional regulator [Bacteroidota bacterium]|nr:AraC family transcriptional regulator [Bacteroidota bacterium]
MQGKKLLHFHDDTITIDCNQLVLLKKGIYTISEYIPEGGEFEALMIFIPEKFLKEFYFNTLESNAPTPTDTPFAIITSNEILNSFKVQYLNYFGKSFKTLRQILSIKLHEIFLILLSSKSKTEVLNFIHSCVSFEHLDIDFIIQKYLFQPITLNELANLSGRSLASFKRDFQKKYNASPKLWINEKRLSHASILLQHTSKNVSEIAYECGFENVSHFNKLFKKKYRIVPNAMRTERVII